MKHILHRRRQLLITGLATPLASVTGGWCFSAQAQERYPSRPIRIVVPFAPGGISDSFARVLGKGVQEQLGQPVVIENKPGGGTVIGTESVVRARPDGYTILLSSAPLATNPGLMAKLPYDTLRDLIPLVQISGQGFVISVHDKQPHKTFAELLAAARQAELPYASPGNGTLMHLVGQVLNAEYGTKFVHVPYRGSAPAVQDVASGQVPVLIDPIATTLPQIQQGRLRPLAVTHPERLPALPQTPTLRELGFAKGEAVAFSGLLLPAGTPPELVALLNKAFNQAMKTPEAQETLVVKLQAPLIGGTPEAFAQLLRSETARWVPLIKRLEIKAD
jgi:tripartite-type tricarboxylate transporter receptor subunit TctC